MSSKARKGYYCIKYFATKCTDIQNINCGFNFGIEIENSAFLLVLINFLLVSRLCWAMNMKFINISQ